MKNKFLKISGVAMCIAALGMNLEYAMNDYGINSGKLLYGILAQGSGSNSGSGSGGGSGSGSGSGTEGENEKPKGCSPDQKNFESDYFLHVEVDCIEGSLERCYTGWIDYFKGVNNNAWIYRAESMCSVDCR